MAKFGKFTRIKLVGGTLNFNLEGNAIPKWAKRHDHFKTFAKDMSPFFLDYGEYQLKSIDRNFVAEGRPKKWTSLAPSTIALRLAAGFGVRPILQRTGRLRRSFKMSATKRTMKITNRVPYFQMHQQDDGAGKKLPRRIMVLLLDQDKAQLTRKFRSHIEGSV